MGFKEARQEIDKIDKEIIRLLKKRFSHLNTIADFKIKKNLPIKDLKREEEVLKNRIGYGDGLGINGKLIQRIFSAVMTESRNIQIEYIHKKKRLHPEGAARKGNR